MITAKAFAGKHYAVYGLARSGLATVEALLASGARVTAWDAKEEARAKLLPRARAGESGRGRRGRSSSARLPGPSTVLRGWSLSPEPRENLASPTSTKPTSPNSTASSSRPASRSTATRSRQRAREAGVEIIGDIELFARARPELPPHKVVGITGTNGKSTTTALVHHILKTAGVPTTMGGNIGLPILAQDPLPEGGVYVLELSSYQIDLTQSLDCDVAVLLNITPDHLDRYESFEAYAASKARLFEMQSPDHDRGDRHAISTRAKQVRSHPSEATLSDGLVLTASDCWPIKADWPALQGPHNAAERRRLRPSLSAARDRAMT